MNGEEEFDDILTERVHTFCEILLHVPALRFVYERGRMMYVCVSIRECERKRKGDRYFIIS